MQSLRVSGLTNSNVASASYTIQPNGTEINYGNGFASVAGLTLNGSATNVDDSRLQLTTGLTYQAASVFYNTPTNIQAFTTDFAFQLSNALADGFTFTIQNVGPTAIGGDGGSLGYGPNPNTGTTGGIAKSVAIKFDFYNNTGEGTDSTGLYVNGAAPTVPAVDMTSSGVLLNSGDTITAHMTYDGVNLIMTLTDIVVNKTFHAYVPDQHSCNHRQQRGVYRLYRRLWWRKLEPEDSVVDVDLTIGIGHADADLLAGRRVFYHGATGDAERRNRRGRDLLHDRWLGSYHLVCRL